jgi:hypothetical protein
MFTAGAVGVAAQNVLRVVEAAMRSGDAWTSLLTIAAKARISAAFIDKNAAGSYFALAVLLAAGLLWHALRGRRAAAASAWAGAVLLTGTALFLSGSRVALAVTLPVAVAALAATRERLNVTRRGLTVATLVVVATVALVATAQARRGRNDAPMAVFVRVEFAATTWRMLQEHPVFGVGAGNYQRASATFSSEALRRVYPTQNAHNNFLQIAGELGVFGLAAFAVLVGLPAWRGWRAARVTGDPIVIGWWAGSVAFLLTCLAGHPFLVPEVAVAAAVALGTLAGAAGPAPLGAPGPRSTRVAAALVAVPLALALSVPLRAHAERATLDLEGALLGKARWAHDHERRRAARFRDTLAFFVRADGRRMNLELRRSPGTRKPVDVTLRLDGRPINVVRLQGSDWQAVPVVLPRVSGHDLAVLRLDVAWAVPGTRGRPVVIVRRPPSAPQ